MSSTAACSKLTQAEDEIQDKSEKSGKIIFSEITMKTPKTNKELNMDLWTL